VLMPTYNNAAFLHESMTSIREQSFEDFEFIIVDDGSDDGSWPILEIAAKEDERIRLIRNEANQGIVYSLNRGLAACRARYIARMDGDDVALRERLERQAAFLDEHPETVALGGALRYVDGRGRDMGIVRTCETEGSLLARNPLLHPTVMLRREVLVRLNLRYEERYRYAEDYFLWLQLSRAGKLSALRDVVLKYRLTQGATRIKHLKGVLLATLRAQLAGMVELGIRPEPYDFLRFFGEAALLCLPSRAVRAIYLRMVLGQGPSTAFR
jgi:glycosyltransferase involved in cell wall biosynthesis